MSPAAILDSCIFSAFHTVRQVQLTLLPRSVQNPSTPLHFHTLPLSRSPASPAWISRPSPNWSPPLLLCRFILPKAARGILKHNSDHVTMLHDRAHVLFISVFHSRKPMFVGLDVRFPLYQNTKHGTDSRVRPTRVVSLLPVCLRWERRSNPSRPSPFSSHTSGASGASPPRALGCWLLTFGVPVTQGRRPHVTQPDCPFAAAVHEGVAVMGVELGRCDHLCELLHVGWLDVDDIWHRRVKEGTRRTGSLGGNCSITALFYRTVLATSTHGGSSS